jgi:hypothetical protein
VIVDRGHDSSKLDQPVNITTNDHEPSCAAVYRGKFLKVFTYPSTIDATRMDEFKGYWLSKNVHGDSEAYNSGKLVCGDETKSEDLDQVEVPFLVLKV